MYEMREKTTNVSFVLNEYGATVGMITLEDLLEEIVGEIRDEYDEDEEELIQKMSDDTYLVEGSMKLDDINDALGTNLTSEDYDSIGGLIIDCLDRLPEDGEEVTLENGIHLKVRPESYCKGIDDDTGSSRRTRCRHRRDFGRSRIAHRQSFLLCWSMGNERKNDVTG